MIIVDRPLVERHGRAWAHLASDTSYEELHAFAAALRLPPRAFDRDHYDIPAELYAAALEEGAVPVSSRQLAASLRAAGLRRPRPRRA